jgi:general secretion pathway protein B
MSFILDALKKSETDRQEQGSAEFANVPVSGGREGAPRWLWILGALLLVNLAVLIGLLTRSGPPEVLRDTVSMPLETSAAEVVPAEPFADQVAAARLNVPPQEEATVVEGQPAPTSAPPSPRPSAASTINTFALPTIHDVVANGTVTLPELHVDIHVYSESPEDRFVFINMVKHKEGSQLAAGPRVQTITPEGVVLSQNGTRFLLPRD